MVSQCYYNIAPEPALVKRRLRVIQRGEWCFAGSRKGFASTWQGRFYDTKEVEAIAVREHEDWLVLTVVTSYH